MMKDVNNKLYWILVTVVLMFLLNSCSSKPNVKPTPTTDKCRECDCKEWRYTTPFFGTDEILEAKGVANPSPNFQKMRDDAIKNAINTISTLYESKINSYSEKFIHEYQDYMTSGTVSNDLFDKLVTASNNNTLNRIKMDECEEPTTGRYWVFVYLSTATIDVVNAETALQLDDYIANEKKEEFRAIMNRELEKARNREKVLSEKEGKKLKNN